MSITAEAIGRNIREARRQAGKMTQQDLAGAVEKSQTAIASYETGQILPSVDVLERIADATGVSVQYLLWGAEAIEVRTAGRCLLTDIVRSAGGGVSTIQVTLTIDPASLAS